jgi:L-lactate dehydrogenase complex protein LldG
VSTREEFLAPVRAAERPEVPAPELPPLRPERGAALVERFAAAAAASGAHVHRGEPPAELGADAGVSRALYGLADTGSVVLAAAPDEPGARSLLPWTHVSLLRVEDILPGLAELFAQLGPDLPSALAIVTGPSRSADIEQRLAVGVHGPGEVHVVLEP